MNRNVTPSANAPTVATLIAAFATSLIGWGVGLLPDTIPAEVVTSGQMLAVAAAAVLIGKLSQRHTWAGDTHAAAVAYARFLDPDATSEHEAEFLAKAGVGTVADAARLIGVDPGRR